MLFCWSFQANALHATSDAGAENPLGSCQAFFSHQNTGPSTVAFTNGSNPSFGLNYSWSFGDGSSSNQLNPSHSYNSPGLYAVCLTIWDSTCQDTYCDSVFVQGSISSCQAGFSVNYSGSTVQFTDQSTSSPSPVIYWVWDFGDGNTAFTQNPNHNYAQSGLYNVCLTIQTTDSCISTTCQQVQASGSSNCQAAFTYNQSSSSTFQFTNTSSPPFGTASSWTFGDGSTSGLPNPNHTYSQAGVYLVCLTIWDSLTFCQSTYCDTVVVQGGGGSSCQSAFSISYSGNTVLFADQSTSSPSPIISWFWDFGDGTTSNAQNPSHNYSQSGLYNACLTIQTADSCISTTCQQLQANGSGNCQALFTYNFTSANSVQFTNASQSTGAVNYFWDFGDGGTSNQTNPSHTYNQSGLYIACLTIYDSLTNCQSTYCDSLFVQGGGSNCQAAFSVSYNGNTVVFNDQSTSSPSPIFNWYWDFGDGTTSNAQNPSHTYNQSGLYNVCLTIETTDSCISTVCQQVQASGGGGCQAYFTYQQGSSNTISFTNASQPLGTNTSWFFGDGGSSSQANPTHTYNQSGYYGVCLTIYDSLTNCQDTYCDTIFVQGSSGSVCQAAFSVSYSGTTVLFNDNSTSSPSPIVNWFWDFGDGNTSGVQNPSHQYAQSGLYNVCLTIQTSDSCISTVCQQVQASGGGGGCQAYFTYNQTGANTFAFTNASQPLGTNTSWSFGDGNGSGQANPTHTYSQGGLYVVCLTIYDSLTNCQDTYCDSVFVQGAPTCNAAFTWSYSGSAVNFVDQSTSSPSPIASWFWDFGDGNTSNSQNPTHTYNAGGLYNVCLTMMSFDSCISTVCQQVQASGGGIPTCNANFSWNYVGSTVVFTDNSTSSPSPISIWNWDFGDGATSTLQNPSHVYANSGLYNVCLTIITFDSCVSTVCYQLQANGGGPNCQASFTVMPDTTGQYAYILTNTSTANSILSYYWDFGDGNTSSQPYPVHQYAGPGTYQICLTIWDSLSWCQDTYCDTITIGPNQSTTVMVQSPNTSLEAPAASQVTVFPNPVQNLLGLKLELPGLADVRVMVVDLRGKVVIDQAPQTLPAGEHVIELDASALSDGLYLTRIQVGAETLTEKVIIRK